MDDERPLVLAIDDEAQNLQLLEQVLQDKYRLAFAKDGNQGLQVIKEVLPDIVLLDIMMPGMDGYEVLDNIKNDEMVSETPVIFLSALSEMEDKVKGLSAGGVDYITKPFQKDEVLARVKTHLDLKFSKDKLQTVSNERKELIHILCHDLTNPFHLINSTMELIDQGIENIDEVKGDLRSAAASGMEIIDLVRKMHALESKKLDLEIINLKQAVTLSALLLKDKFRQKKIDVLVNIDENLTVLAEKTSFVNSVLSNVFSNAVKFSNRGSKVTVQAEEKGENVIITIRDSGTGMSKKHLGEVFDLNKKTSRPGTEKETGTGFGMPLVKKFMTAYSGTIEIESKQAGKKADDHGTTVSLSLRTKLKKILIIDDEEPMRRTLRKLLEANGFEVIEAEDGIDGIYRAKQETPDLILLDVSMPELDGIEICRRIKEFEKLQNIPIVMASSMSDQKLVDIAMEKGAEDYIIKPYSTAKLVEKVNKYL